MLFERRRNGIGESLTSPYHAVTAVAFVKKEGPKLWGLLPISTFKFFSQNENSSVSEAGHRQQNCWCFRSTPCRLTQKKQQRNLMATLPRTKNRSKNWTHHANLQRLRLRCNRAPCLPTAARWEAEPPLSPEPHFARLE